MKGNPRLSRKVLLGTLLAAGSGIIASAQISFGGTPASFHSSENHIRSTQTTARVLTIRPDFNPDDERAIHRWDKTTISTKPQTIGRKIAADIDFARDAVPTVLEDGRLIYRLEIKVKDARGILLTYDDFFIPQGGELFIYTPDRSQVLGAYTYATHPKHGEFATEPIRGSRVILEYTPSPMNEMPSLIASNVVHLFETKDLPSPQSIHQQDEASNEFCQINVNCAEGAEWQKEKTGVVQMYMISREGASFCTGNLLNNTEQDFRPLILSAAHCESSNAFVHNTEKDRNQWVFTFHYEKPGCSNGALSMQRGKSMVGCKLLAFLPIKGQSDGLLLELNDKIPASYRVYYNGWDRREKLPLRGVGIHHPGGDAKKISPYDHNVSPVREGTWISGGAFSPIMGDNNAHYLFSFVKGSTEGGSSGSSLWNEDHLVIGTLSGGSDGCALNSENLYGKLSNHWDVYKKEGDTTTEMAIHLDPKGKGTAEKLEGRWRDDAGYLRPVLPISDLKIVKENGLFKISWVAPSRDQIPTDWTIDYRLYRNGKEIASNLNKTEFAEPYQKAVEESHGTVVYGVQAHYSYNGAVIDATEEKETYADCIQEGIYVGDATRKLTPSVQKEANGVTLSWRRPYNMQEVSLCGYSANPEYSKLRLPHINREGKEKTEPPFQTIASKFPSEYFTSNGKEVYIHAISYIPTHAATGNYKLFLRYGNSANSNTIVNDLFDVPEGHPEKTWYTVYLKRPFKVDPLLSLWVGFSTRNAKTDVASIYALKGTDDQDQQYIDALFSRDLGRTFLSRRITDGYLAMRVHVSDNPLKLSDQDDESIYAGGKRPVPFPIIKEYVIKKNGSEVTRLTGGDALSYTDPSGKETDNYTIEVVYENGEVLPTEAVVPEITPDVYPTTLNPDGLLHLSAWEKVAYVRIYTLDGLLVQSSRPTSSTISLAELNPASYLVVLETLAGQITRKITR